MKKIFIVILLFVAVVTAQEKNKLVADEKSGKPMLLGMCDRAAFADTNFAWWYDSEASMYSVDSVSLVGVCCKMGDVRISIVMGTWCSDSRREVPRFLKILDNLRYDQQDLTLICVDRSKSAPDCGVEKMEIKFVPTMIFYRNENEIGRIIESPKETLEKDIAAIILN